MVSNISVWPVPPVEATYTDSEVRSTTSIILSLSGLSLHDLDLATFQTPAEFSPAITGRPPHMATTAGSQQLDHFARYCFALLQHFSRDFYSRIFLRDITMKVIDRKSVV